MLLHATVYLKNIKQNEKEVKRKFPLTDCNFISNLEIVPC